MTTPQLSITARACHSTAFLDDAGDLFADINKSGARTDVDLQLFLAIFHQRACARLEAEGHAATYERHQLRHRLRLGILGVVRLAQARLPNVPGVPALVVPHRNDSAVSYLAAAHSAADIARRHEAPLVAYGMGEHTLRHLTERAASYRAALDADRERVEDKRQARVLLKRNLARLRVGLRALDGLVVSHLVGKPGLAAQWSAILAGRAIVLPSRAA